MAGDVIGRGVIEVAADASKLNATIADARAKLKGLGQAGEDSAKKASASIDRYIRNLETQNKLLGKSAREAELYKLALRGASDEQLRAANHVLKLNEAYAKGEEIGNRMRTGFLALGAAIAAGTIAAAVAVDQLLKKAGNFQDLAEKTGDTAENIASLALAAGSSGASMEEIASASVKLTKNLTGVDDESADAGAAIKALGLNLAEFKALKPADQIEAVAKAMADFEEGPQKAAVAMALFGKSGADLLPFLKELGQEGARQIILTEEQIALADEYADKQAKLRTEISLHAQAISTQAAPALNEFMQTISDIAKDQEFAATAAEVMNGAMQAGIVVFQTIAVTAANVAFVFKGVGREIGAIAAQLVALATLDFSGFSAISDMVKADGEKAAAELKRFEEKVMNIGQAKPGQPDPSNYGNEGRNYPQKKKKLIFNGGTGDGAANKLAQEAKARLASDLDQIKNASEAITNTFSNAEKIMDARRAANLIDEAQYWEAKREFVRLNSFEQEQELQKEIARLEQEKLIGKDRIANEKKIADVRAKLAKVGENSAAALVVLGIQEQASIDRITDAYNEAKVAADAYIASVERQNARTVSGVGMGNKFRQEQAELNRIEDKYIARQLDLQGDLRRKQITPEQYDQYLRVAQDTYSREVDLFKKSRTDIETAQAEGFRGITESLHNYADEARKTSDMMAQTVGNALGGLEDSFVEFATKGKLSFKDLLDSIHADLARAGFRTLIGRAIEGLSGDTFGNLGKSIGSAAGGMLGTAAPGATQTANTLALSANTSATTQATLALEALAIAADNAAISMGGTAASSSGGSVFGSIIGAVAGLFGGGYSYTGDQSGSMFSATGEAIRGRRAIGGPVGANGLYEVNEKGPELLSVAGRQYLMMGDHPGTVEPAKGDAAQQMNQTINFYNSGPIDRRTQAQLAAVAFRGGQRAISRNG